MNYIGISVAVMTFFYSHFFCPAGVVSFSRRSVTFCCDQSKHANVNSFYKGTGEKKKIKH